MHQVVLWVKCPCNLSLFCVSSTSLINTGTEVTTATGLGSFWGHQNCTWPRVALGEPPQTDSTWEIFLGPGAQQYLKLQSPKHPNSRILAGRENNHYCSLTIKTTTTMNIRDKCKYSIAAMESSCKDKRVGAFHEYLSRHRWIASNQQHPSIITYLPLIK